MVIMLSRKSKRLGASFSDCSRFRQILIVSETILNEWMRVTGVVRGGYKVVMSISRSSIVVFFTLYIHLSLLNVVQVLSILIFIGVLSLIIYIMRGVCAFLIEVCFYFYNNILLFCVFFLVVGSDQNSLTFLFPDGSGFS